MAMIYEMMMVDETPMFDESALIDDNHGRRAGADRRNEIVRGRVEKDPVR